MDRGEHLIQDAVLHSAECDPAGAAELDRARQGHVAESFETLALAEPCERLVDFLLVGSASASVVVGWGGRRRCHQHDQHLLAPVAVEVAAGERLGSPADGRVISDARLMPDPDLLVAGFQDELRELEATPA